MRFSNKLFKLLIDRGIKNSAGDERYQRHFRCQTRKMRKCEYGCFVSYMRHAELYCQRYYGIYLGV